MNMNAISKVGGKLLMKLQKNAPGILFVVGTVAIVGGGVLACIATTHVDEVIEETHKELNEVDLHVKPTKMDYVKVYARCAWKFVKLYGPAACVVAGGIFCTSRGYIKIRGRYLGATAACTTLQEAYNKYRKNVIDAVGEEAEEKIRLGLSDKENIQVNEELENGDVVLTEKSGVVIDPKRCASPYAVFFDESSDRWTKNPEFNKLTLITLQQLANEMYDSQGHMFLNEVYDMIGVPRTQAGAVVGWIKGAGDDYIDFGIHNAFSEKARDFVNGYERSILLDFNVDGVIYDKI